jgi:hypothetical protein
MPVNLLSYTGDANLGFGSNPNLAPSANVNLDAINSTARNIMLLDNERNMKLFQQKVADRDNLEAMIANDQVAIGDILPEYQPVFDKAKKNMEDVFFKWKGDFNDTDGFQKYKAARQELKDVALKAQVNTVGIKKLEQEKAQKKLPRDIEDMDKHLKTERAKSIWDDITPYQNAHDFSMASILSGVNEQKRTVPDPKDPLKSYDESFVDYDDVLRNKRNDFVNDREAADDIDQFYGKLQRLDTPALMKTINGINSQLELYNAERNLSPGKAGYAPPVVTEVVDVDGEDKLVIQEPKSDFAAKYALANRPSFTSRAVKFNKDLAKNELDKKELDLKAKALGINADKAKAYVRNLDAKTRQLQTKLEKEGTSIKEMVSSFVNNVTFEGLEITQPDGSKSRRDIVNMRNLPKGFQFINGVIIDSKGKVSAGQLEPFAANKDGEPYYISKYVHPGTKETFTLNKMPADLQEGFNLTKKKSPGITKDAYIRALMNGGKLELVLQGKNGTANFTSMLQSAQALNATGTTKGEENIINAPEGDENE